MLKLDFGKKKIKVLQNLYKIKFLGNPLFFLITTNNPLKTGLKIQNRG